MQKDDKTVDFQELAEVLHSAQLRRTADLGGWFREYLEARRQARTQKRAIAKNAVVTALHRPAT